MIIFIILYCTKRMENEFRSDSGHWSMCWIDNFKCFLDIEYICVFVWGSGFILI